jgi:hypothetical protein
VHPFVTLRKRRDDLRAKAQNPVIPVSWAAGNFSQALIPLWVAWTAGYPHIPQGRPANDRKSGLGDIATRCSDQAVYTIGPSITFKDYPIRQTPASFNLDKVLAQIERAGSR